MANAGFIVFPDPPPRPGDMTYEEYRKWRLQRYALSVCKGMPFPPAENSPPYALKQVGKGIQFQPRKEAFHVRNHTKVRRRPFQGQK